MSPVSMSDRALLRFVLTGQGTDGARSRAVSELFLRGHCTLHRMHKLWEKGFWAARPLGEEAF